MDGDGRGKGRERWVGEGVPSAKGGPVYMYNLHSTGIAKAFFSGGSGGSVACFGTRHTEGL